MDILTKEYLFQAVLSWYSNPENVKKNFAHRNAMNALESKTLGHLLFVTCDIYGISTHALSKGSAVTMSRLGEFVRGQPLSNDESVKIRKFLSHSFGL